jgi:hypothetical protein
VYDPGAAESVTEFPKPLLIVSSWEVLLLDVQASEVETFESRIRPLPPVVQVPSKLLPLTKVTVDPLVETDPVYWYESYKVIFGLLS